MQKPERQTFKDGVCNIHSVKNAAPRGSKPVDALEYPPVHKELRYAERRVGVIRFWNAKQNEVQVDRVIRIPACGSISAMHAVIMPDGEQYEIKQIQKAFTAPESYDLTLEKRTVRYDCR